MKSLIAGLALTAILLFGACREFPPSDNKEDNDITINNNNHIDIGLPADNSSENTDIDLTNDSESDSQSDSDSQSESDSSSSSDNSTSSRSSSKIINSNGIVIYEFKMIQ